MNKISQLEEIAATIQSYGFEAQQIESIKLNEPIIVAIKNDSRGKIMIFSEKYGMDCIASISYAINNVGVYVSTFVVIEEMQQKGIGRLMWDLAMAHGDSLGKTCIYGEANPTDPIYGVSGEEGVNFKQEQEKIREIYGKLGCKLDGKNFIRTWRQGEILKSSNKDVISLINKINKKEQPEKQ